MRPSTELFFERMATRLFYSFVLCLCFLSLEFVGWRRLVLLGIAAVMHEAVTYIRVHFELRAAERRRIGRWR